MSNEGVSILNAEWDFQRGSALKDFLFASESESTRKFGASSKCRQPNATVSSMVSSSQECEFYGFTPTSAAEKSAPCESISENPLELGNYAIENKLQSSDSLVKRAIGSTECGSAQTIGSEEFSDQDIRCRNDMDKDEIRRCEQNEDNASPSNVSRFTIEPTSSDDEEELTNRATVLKIQDSSSNLHTLSINENSNNAVDNAISCTSSKPETELTDLSFNGKLKPEPTISETTNSIHVSMKPETENKKDLNISNASDKSNLEWQLQLETSREHINERSPDLFSDDEDLDNDNNEHSAVDVIDTTDAVDVNDSTEVTNEEKDRLTDNCIEKTERATSKRIQALLSGILPPPSVTFIQHDITNLLSIYKRNVALMEQTVPSDEDSKRTETCDQMSVPVMPKQLDNVEWPQLKRINAYGLHYNRTKYTDNIEMMYMKLVERNVGQETGTSFTFSMSTSAKKKPIRKLYV